MTSSQPRIAALAGGVGGAKMLQGLAGVIGAANLTAIVNTADDFELYGLRISPDVDTVLYTLAGIANPQTGWGIAGDSRATLEAIARYGEEPWFQIGDQDFATHILRSSWLREGASLTTVTARLANGLDVGVHVLPMSDDDVRTHIRVADGWLGFQEYFVGRRHADAVIDVRFDGVERASPAPGVIDAIQTSGLIMICPSNPVVSIDPILQVPEVRSALSSAGAPVVCVSPIVGGKALKGPAAGMLASKGMRVDAVGVATWYDGLVDIMVIDRQDAVLVPELEHQGMRVIVLDTVMGDEVDRIRLSREILDAL